jgi:hypothetical protein
MIARFRKGVFDDGRGAPGPRCAEQSAHPHEKVPLHRVARAPSAISTVKQPSSRNTAAPGGVDMKLRELQPCLVNGVMSFGESDVVFSPFPPRHFG